MMDEGRFESLGRAIYRAFETGHGFEGWTDEPQLMECMKSVKTLMEKLLALRQKQAQGLSPDVQNARDVVIEDIENEIKALNLVIEWFGERDKRKEIFSLAQWEAEKAQKMNK